MQITPSDQACGATIAGVDLTQPLSSEEVLAIREAWLEHHVIAFPEQQMNDDDLEHVALGHRPHGVGGEQVDEGLD